METQLAAPGKAPPGTAVLLAAKVDSYEAGVGIVTASMLPIPAALTADTVRSEGIAAEIKALHCLARYEYARHAIRCGELLLQQKERMRHGGFQKWIEDKCEFAYSTAARYMAAARANLSRGEISDISARLLPSGRKPQRQKVARKVAAPAPITASASVGMTADQAVEILRRQPNSARHYARLIQRYRAEKKALETGRRAFDNTVQSVLRAARKIEVPKIEEAPE